VSPRHNGTPANPDVVPPQRRTGEDDGRPLSNPPERRRDEPPTDPGPEADED
jgi:hypothetical protein